MTQMIGSVGCDFQFEDMVVAMNLDRLAIESTHRQSVRHVFDRLIDIDMFP
jgi:hypothetical protein